MKRKLSVMLAAAILLICVVVGVAVAFLPPQSWMVPSAVKSADGAALTAPGWLYGMMVTSDGANAITVDLYDNASAASGPVVAPTWRIATSTDNRSHWVSFDPPLVLNNGLYVDVTTAGSLSYVVYYRAR